MKIFPNRLILSLITGLVVLGALSIQFSTAAPSRAQGETSLQTELPGQTERPFQLPFEEPSGPDTWLMAQPYGNTTGAYRQRFTTYGASGGIHFGLDLAAPCGTEIVAIADGIVFAVDGPFGSPPHNLMIDHPQLGYASLYGHLLQAPDLTPGQRVEQGEVIALTGDTAETCYGRPHLHLEIRDLNHVRKFNPTRLIEADWDNLSLIGSSGRDFARDLDDPRRWQSLYDQPEARTGGPIINDFANPWPLDWRKRAPVALAPVSQEGSGSTAIPSFPQARLAISTYGRQITAGNCCIRPFWSEDSAEVRFIDQPTGAAPLGVWGVRPDQPEPVGELVTERLAVYSPDGNYIAFPNGSEDVAIIERIADGQRWEIDNQERSVSFTPDSRRVLWTTYDEDAPRDRRVETIWLADVDGSNVRAVFSGRRTDSVAWLSDNELLMTRRLAGTSDRELFTLSVDDGVQAELTAGPRMRGLALSPDKRLLVYYVSLEQNRDKNGVWLLDLQNPGRGARKLPFFGSYRWRDNQRLIYVPHEPTATEHVFYEYNIDTEQTRRLFPDGPDLIIANNDWRVSPDGRRLALVAANGTELDGIWVLDID